MVAREGATVAFVEVKTRRPGPAAPLEALDRKKRRDLRLASQAWIHDHPGSGREFRFDAVSVLLPPGGPPEVEHVRNAFFGDEG